MDGMMAGWMGWMDWLGVAVDSAWRHRLFGLAWGLVVGGGLAVRLMWPWVFDLKVEVRRLKNLLRESVMGVSSVSTTIHGGPIVGYRTDLSDAQHDNINVIIDSLGNKKIGLADYWREYGLRSDTIGKPGGPPYFLNLGK